MSTDDRAVHRRIGWFRHVDEVTHNVAKTCRYFGISRQTYYRWYRRHLRLGESGLRNGSSRPHHSPRATPFEVVEKILYLSATITSARLASACTRGAITP